MFQREPLDENLLDELTRLVGRPQSVLGEMLGGVMESLMRDLDSESARSLAVFPMTAWQSLAPSFRAAREAWSTALSAGLTAEEVFTAFAVVDDHVRRTYGADAWQRIDEWGPRLVGRFHLDDLPRAVGAGWPAAL